MPDPWKLRALEGGAPALTDDFDGLLDNRGDGPLLPTLSRASSALMQDGRAYSVVWEPPGK